MLVLTGAIGFIGSCLLTYLNEMGHEDILLVDDFSRTDKLGNIQGKAWRDTLDRDDFLEWLQNTRDDVEFIFHIGARTDTTLKDQVIFDRLNVNYTQSLAEICSLKSIPLMYASSAATYGLGLDGFSDRHELSKNLQPLNPYGWSKQIVDQWILSQEKTPPLWYGLKFFNVYGPNEYHKGRMASVVWHASSQIRETGKMKLFRSHREGIRDGYQSRDFIYIKDVVKRCYEMFSNRPLSGLYNVGTGKDRTFLDLTKAVFAAMELKEDIEFIDTPLDIRSTYQYYTCSDQTKYNLTELDSSFTPLEEGVRDYVSNYLHSGPRIY